MKHMRTPPAKRRSLLLTLLMATGLALLSAYTMAHEDSGQAADASGTLVLMLTQTDPMVAGHALHFAAAMVQSGRPATIILVGDAGTLALKGAASRKSEVSGLSLQADLETYIKAGGRVIITPYTLTALNAKPDALMDGVALPSNPVGLHDLMFEHHTQLVVW
ncbi:MAG: hypothetical protein AAGH19_02865, partial [Pseudomonadota bacterium]